MIALIIIEALVIVAAAIYLYKIRRAYIAEQRMITWYQQRLRISPWMVKD